MEAEGRIMLYAASVLPLKDAELYRLAYNDASPERRRKADNCRVEKDRRLSLGAEMLLRYGLREANVEFERMQIVKNACGKPYLKGAELYYNISHSEDWVICAISDVEIGCDIEKIRSAKLKIAERYFCPEEYAHISAQESENERNLLFYRYWTLKESFVKAVGSGLKLPFRDFCIKLEDGVRVVQSADQRAYFLAELGDISGYCCAVCLAGERRKVQLKVIDFCSLWQSR